MTLYLPLPSAESVAPRGAVDLAWNLLHLSSLSIFLFMTVVPSPALAYAQHLSTSQGPLVFVRDDELAAQALSSIDFAPRRISTIQSVDQSQVTEGATLRVLAFAYSSSEGQTDGDPFTTATGSRVTQGTLAANWLPFNTQVRIGGLLYTVEDRMNSRYDDKYVIDLWQPSSAAAVDWGARMVDVEIVSLP